MTGPRPQLTVEQRYLLALLADGHTHAAIGHRLGMTKTNVATRCSRAYARLGARNSTHAVAIAIRAGLLPTPNLGAHHQ